MSPNTSDNVSVSLCFSRKCDHTFFHSACSHVPMLLLYASELAACADMHRYQPQRDVMLKVWQRVDPVSFQLAQRRTSTKEIVPVQIHDKILQEATSSTPAQLEKEIEKIMNTPLIQVDEKTVQNIQAAACRNNDADVVALLTPSATLTESAKAIIQSTAQTICRAATSKPASQVRTEIEDAISLIKVKDTASAAAGEIKSKVYTSRGTSGEQKGIAKFEQTRKKTVTQRNDTFYKKVVKPEFSIGGRVDGITDDGECIVEVKCRQKRFFSTLPLYEKVQIQCYMWLTDIHCCELAQQFDGEVQSDTYEFDEDFWEEVLRAVDTFVHDLLELLQSPVLQDRFMIESNIM